MYNESTIFYKKNVVIKKTLSFKMYIRRHQLHMSSTFSENSSLKQICANFGTISGLHYYDSEAKYFTIKLKL